MANANNNIITGRISGLLGKQLVFREWEGKTVVAKAPKARSGTPSPEQVEIQEKFLLASRYARSIIRNADQSMADAYATALRVRQNVYSRALEDFLSPPVVIHIDRENYQGAVGDRLVVRALDDFRITGVRVEVYDASGSRLELGPAEQNLNGLDWTYTVTVANSLLTGSKIKAIVTDVPGNKGTLEITL